MSLTMIDDVFKAIQSGDAAGVKAMLASNPELSNTENGDGLTPLGFAAHFGHADIAQALLDHGAEVNAVSHSKIAFIPSNTALHAAIAGERNLDVIKLLLSRNADTNVPDSNGLTSLHTAAFHDDNIEIIRLLIAYGADVNAKADGIKTPLSIATEKGNNRVAQLLRDHEGGE